MGEGGRSILELVRTHFVAVGGEEFPPRKFGKAAKPHRSKPQKNPEKNIGSNHYLQNRKWQFETKIPYNLVAAEGGANSQNLTFPIWRAWEDLNLRPPDPQSGALSAELQAHKILYLILKISNLRVARTEPENNPSS